MHALCHPHILFFHSWYETTNHLWLILEFCVGGDLRSLLQIDKQLPEATVVKFAKDLASALQYIHSLNIVHCDLTPSNLLLDENGQVKIGGFSKSLRKGEPVKEHPITPYLAPELLQPSSRHTIASDLWSLGCILYECTSGRPPFMASSASSLAASIQTAVPEPLKGVSPALQDMIWKLLEKNPSLRLTWSGLCTHSVWGESPLEPLSVPSDYGDDTTSQAQCTVGLDVSLIPETQTTDTSPTRVTLPSADVEYENTKLGNTPLHPSSHERATSNKLEAQRLPGRHDSLSALDALIWHSSDFIMRPIVGNKKIDIPLEPLQLIKLPFQAMPVKDIMVAPSSTRGKVLHTISRALSSSGHDKNKLTYLYYLEILSASNHLAHEILSSDIGSTLVHLLKYSISNDLKIRSANVLGLLIRHASIINDQLQKQGLIDALHEAIQSNDIQLQRRSAAAFGELVFYVASQQRDPRAADNAWEVPDQLVFKYAEMLNKPDIDEVVQHYVAKTMENIAGQNGPWAAKIATLESTLSLYQVVLSAGKSTPKSDTFRGTAASALCRILWCEKSLLQPFLDHVGIRFFTQGLCDSSLRVQQSTITILGMLCTYPASVQSALSAIKSTPALLRFIGGIIDSPVDVLKAKGIALTAVLCRHERSLLAAIADAGLLQLSEKAGRDSHQYVIAAFEALKAELTCAMKQFISLDQIPFLLHLLGSPILKNMLPSDDIIHSLAKMLVQVDESNSDEISITKIQVLQVFEIVSSNQSLFMINCEAIITEVLPILSKSVASSTESPDTRFLCLKLLCDVILQCVTEPDIYEPVENSSSAHGKSNRTDLINYAVLNLVLPCTPKLLSDEDPMPLYALKLLGILLGVNASWLQALPPLGLECRFFEWLSIDHPHNNVHNIRLCCLTAKHLLSVQQICSLDALDRVLAVLAYARELEVDPFIEPSLELCMTLLQRLAEDPSGFAESEKVLPALPLMLDLCTHPDPSVSTLSAACLLESVQMHLIDASAIIMSDTSRLSFWVSTMLRPGDAGINEAAAVHILHTLSLIAPLLANKRNTDVFQHILLCIGDLQNSSCSSSMKQAAVTSAEFIAELEGNKD